MLFSLFFAFLPLFVNAEITHPYTVDEKPQVLFGDSAEILVPNADHTATTTYKGLENYRQEYVGGYAHFSFTYTHDRCCYAGYPPMIYVTDVNPTSTPTYTEKAIFPILNAPSLYWYGPTDWYLVDVQFDVTGFTIIIKQAGVNEIWNAHTDITNLSASDWIAVANRYPRQDKPYPTPEPSQYAMSFTPVSVSETPLPQAPDPVIIIPGIVGAELYNGSDLIWLDLSQTVADVNDYFLTDNLSLDNQGFSLHNIRLGNAIKKMTALLIFNQNIFEGLQQNLELNNYQENQNLFFFPYDWRLDLNTTSDLLKQKIDEVKIQTGRNKVNIVAHSMGGLLVKDYLNQYGKGSVNKLIFVGTPHLGAPKAGKVLLEGDRFGIPWLEEDRIRDIAQNSPALHELLPNKTYFNEFQGYLRKYSILGDNPLISYEETKNFFLNDKNKNPVMFQKAENFYNQNLDNFDFSGIETYNIVGCKTPTQTAYSFGILNEIGQTGYTSGDGTVPMASANYVNIPNPNKFYVKDGNHAELPSASGVRDLILEILGNKTINLVSNVSNDSSFCNFKGKKLTWHSPVEIHIYDKNGNHTGPIENNAIEYGIPEIDYDVMGHNKFIFLPTDNTQEYSVEAKGLENGSFDLSISEIDNGQYLTTQVFNDVPVTASTISSFVVSNLTNNSIELRDKGITKEIPVSTTLNGEIALDLIPPETTAKVVWIKNKNPKSKKNLQITLNVTDNQSGILKTLYSLDEGNTYNIYSGPVIVEKKTDEILFYSIDNAGNNEEAKEFDLEDNKLKKCINWKCLDINKKHNRIEGDEQEINERFNIKK